MQRNATRPPAPPRPATAQAAERLLLCVACAARGLRGDDRLRAGPHPDGPAGAAAAQRLARRCAEPPPRPRARGRTGAPSTSHAEAARCPGMSRA